MLTASRSASSAASVMSPAPPIESERLPAAALGLHREPPAREIAAQPDQSTRIRIGWLGRRSMSRWGRS
jgi:hypothetical protein